MIPHVAPRQKRLCVAVEALAAGVSVNGRAPQGKHSLEEAEADMGRRNEGDFLCFEGLNICCFGLATVVY